MDVTGFKYAIKAELLNCGKVPRYLKILENIGLKNTAKNFEAFTGSYSCTELPEFVHILFQT